MTFFMGFSIVGYLAIFALLWCLRGFSRELKHGRKVIGIRVKVVPRRSALKNCAIQPAGKIGEIKPRMYSKYGAKMVHLARVLESRRQVFGGHL